MIASPFFAWAKGTPGKPKIVNGIRSTPNEAWAAVCGFLHDSSYAMVILDEFNIALQHDYVRLEDVLPVLEAGPSCSMW